MAKAITELGADIVGLNEMYNGGEGDFFMQTTELSYRTGLSYSYFAKAIHENIGDYGNGFISRYPIVKVETIIIPDPNPRRIPDGFYETRCLLKATLENGYTVLVTHFGLCRDEQENAVDTIVNHILPEKCILMGDFNVPPDDAILDPIRAKMKDTASLLDGEGLSWPSDKPQIKIDYIFVSPDIEVVSADVPSIVASDHRPHVAEIKDKQ
jgi:endonuclease/exonuclease/phosphatase family metal-dependent hydrolase